MTSKSRIEESIMASRARTRLTLDEVLLGIFDDDFGLSDSETVRRKEKMSILTLESII